MLSSVSARREIPPSVDLSYAGHRIPNVWQILESTNSLISLMTEISDPVYLLGLLRASLDRYISSHHLQPGDANGETSDQIAARARASGYLFGLNAIGMCVLRLPAPVIEIEAPKLTGAIMDVSLHLPLSRRSGVSASLISSGDIRHIVCHASR